MKHRHTHLILVGSSLAAALLGIMISGCSGEGPGGKTYAAGNSSSQPELFTVPSNQMAHVQVITIQPTTWPRVLRLTGAVAYNGFLTTPVITQVGGPVSRIVVSPGQKLKQSEPMLYVSSPDYTQLRANYLKARDAYNLAEKSYLRSKDLYAHSAIATRDLEAAESADVQARADLQAAEQALKVLGIPKPDELVVNPTSPEVPLLAPISGEVVERLCAPGQVIQAGQTQCFTVSNMRTVWVFANVYENQLAYVHVGDQVSITTDAYPDVFKGHISFMGAALDPTSRTLQARIDTVNPGEKLRKDMYVTATVAAGQIKDALVVPDAAVLRDAQNEPFVYIESGTNQFARRSIKVGESNHGQTQVLNGLAVGDRVVGDGSLFLQFANSLQ